MDGDEGAHAELSLRDLDCGIFAFFVLANCPALGGHLCKV